MKKFSKILMFSALALASLAACSKKSAEKIEISGNKEWGVGGVTTLKASVEGVTWSSSDESVATVSENGQLKGVSAGTVTITASKDNYTSGSLEVLIKDYETLTAEEYGVFLDAFISNELGFLTVSEGNLVVSSFDGSEDQIFYVTSISEETVFKKIYDDQGNLIKLEEVTNTYVNYGFEHNEVAARLSIVDDKETSLGSVLLEITDNGEYKEVGTYRPQVSEFAGAYNGLSSEDLSPNNYVYFFDSMYDFDYEGYTIGSYYDGSYGFTGFVLQGGFYQTKDGYKKGAVIYDSSDEAYYEGTLALPKDGVIDMIDPNGNYGYFYADASIYFTNIVDEEGTVYKNKYDFDENGKIHYYVNENEVQVSYSNTENGLVVSVKEDGKQDKDLYINASSLAVIEGEKDYYFSPVSTFDSISDAGYIEYGGGISVTDGQLQDKITFGLMMDEDWNDIETVLYNDESVEYKIVASDKVYAKLSFTTSAGEKVEVMNLGNIFYNVVKETEEESSEALYFRYDAIINYFGRDFVKFGTTTEEFSFDFEAEEINFEVVYSPENGLTLESEKGSLALINPEIGLFALFTSDTDYSLVVDKQYLEDAEGTFTNNGTNTFSFEDLKLTFNGEEVNYSLELLNTDNGYLFGFFGANKFFIPQFNGVYQVYSVNGGSISGLSYYVSSPIFEQFVGDYSYEGTNGVETITFTEDGKLLLPNQKDVSKQDEYKYSFGKNSNDQFMLNVSVSSTSTLAITLLNYAYKIGPLYYVDHNLFLLNGGYGDKTSNTTLFISKTVVIVNEKSENIVDVEREENEIRLTTSAHYIVATLDENEKVSTIKVAPVTDKENLTTLGDRLDSVFNNLDGLTATYKDGETEYTITSKFSDANGDILLQSYENGKMFAPTNAFVCRYVDDKLCLVSELNMPIFKTCTTYVFAYSEADGVTVTRTVVKG